jgi:Fe-S oxidoreductase
MRVLPMLEARRASLETCVFCPKLCRSACPVSNAEPRETLTPWGKMSLAWMAAHGDVPLDASHGHPAWACTGCFACREACDHRNGVADALLDTRDALNRQGVAPEGAQKVLSGFRAHDEDARERSRQLSSDPSLRGVLRSEAFEALLVGCSYLRHHPHETREAIAVTSRLGELGGGDAEGSVALVEPCCGLPLRLAGDTQAFVRHARVVATSLRGKTRVTVVDAGCALTLARRYPAAGVELAPRVELLVERAARCLPRLSSLAPSSGPVRWHDPCQLGRGLGVYEAPRAVLGRALGRTPDEFDDRRDAGACSGAGGLLPSTMPEIAHDIASTRLEMHRRAGGGRIVTACASSLRSLRAASARAGASVGVDDLVTWMARSLGVSGPL